MQPRLLGHAIASLNGIPFTAVWDKFLYLPLPIYYLSCERKANGGEI
jgi:hypothetical protein